MKKVEHDISEEMKDLIARSIIGVCVRTHKLDLLMEELLSNWKWEGTLECRDIGPNKFILTFVSSMIKNQAWEDPLLKSTFDGLDRYGIAHTASVEREFGRDVYSLQAHPESDGEISEDSKRNVGHYTEAEVEGEKRLETQLVISLENVAATDSRSYGFSEKLRREADTTRKEQWCQGIEEMSEKRSHMENIIMGNNANGGDKMIVEENLNASKNMEDNHLLDEEERGSLNMDLGMLKRE
ncbi:hypothetical protein PIB30_044023 [Stylosanthes scabra]|uniref:DUF4283 domain-containing protein n=1 Tax=Stylosanthes scabra TaxID=79078 RepID=A0ABU6YD37_9FABA|nr:hypothetical protein [Stylosanthes scabra]